MGTARGFMLYFDSTLANVLGRKHTRHAARRPDYILFLRRNYPIAVVEAKVEYKQSGDGLQTKVDVLK
jgi:type I site-specific restriction endonuclease